jgi:FkbM family methyltransferase
LVKKIIKRIVEALTKAYFLDLVRGSYLCKSGEQHRSIAREAKIWFGIGPKVGAVRKGFARWYVDFVLQARIDLFKRKECSFVLQDAGIGFEDLVIHCAPTDSNSTFVYLLGFTDNIVSFDLLKEYVLSGTVAVDVGANMGMYSMVMSKCVGTPGKVIAFEPLDVIHERFLKNIRLNGLTNIETRTVGIGARPGTFKFDSNAQDFNIGKGHLSDTGDREILVATIDDELRDISDRVSFIKIDIEGGELDALKGAQGTLRRHKPAIMCEFNAGQYSFSDLKEHIPFQARYFRIPETFNAPIVEIVHDLNERTDILVVAVD